MEEIYDDLDNYNEVNCIQELRTENTELKVKLEEHATALEKLQRDYDTLASEFKKLENNYSSLLKTARSEIERKTLRITQLNKEKDMMVINAVQKGIPIKRHFNKSYQANTQNKMAAETPSGNKKVKEDFKTNIDAKNERCETQSKNNEPILGPSNKSDYHKAKEIQTLHKTEHTEPPVTLASSIKDRRKSTPAVAMPHDKFSSDDEFDHNNPAKSNRDIPPNTKFDRRNINRFDRQGNKSETSSLEDRNSNYRESSRNYHEYSKDYKGGRPTRPYDKSSYRGRDKYDSSSRYGKHYSPERLPKRPQRDFKDDYSRPEHGRYRTPESPPHEPFSRYHHRNEDPHSNFDRHAHDYEKHRPSYEERFALKHRLSGDYDEPHSKRQRTESFGNPDIHFKEDRHNKPYHSHDVIDKQRTSRFSPDEYENLRATCQSPDYVHSDSAVIKPKEIMATAATPLDDPRVTSKKYVVKKENGKEVLSTSVGRNVDIKPVDKSVWKIKPIDIPAALVRRPSQCSEGIVTDLNYLSNISIESGELCFESDNENRESNKAKEAHHTKNNLTNSAKQKTNVDKCELSNTKYRIPKVGQNIKKSEPKLNVPVIEVGEYVAKSKNVPDKVVIADSSKKVTDKIESHKHDNILSSNKMNNNKKCDKDDYQNRVSLSSIAIVADDLELSDDNSDNVDTHKQVMEKVTKQTKELSKITEAKKDVSKNKIMNNTNSQQEKVSDNVSESVHLSNVHEKSKESDCTKKHNSKKKRTKSKEGSSKDLVKSTDVTPECEKKRKPKHEKDCKSKESHNKFSDLFGDTSSSLMTPEDLGLPSFLPICENSLDMKIDDIIDVQTQKISDRPDVKPKPIKPAEQIKIPKKIIMENKIQDVIQKPNTEENKEVSEKEHQLYSNDIPLSDMYKNLNSEADTNEPGVVQTVIISKGLQQQFDDSNAAVMEKPVEDVPLNTNCNQIQAIISFKKQDMKALATSTPHKELTDFAIGTESAIKDFQGHSNNNIINSAINQSQPTALDTQDAPDVRIFVKRRRKVVKQAPVT